MDDPFHDLAADRLHLPPIRSLRYRYTTVERRTPKRKRWMPAVISKAKEDGLRAGRKTRSIGGVSPGPSNRLNPVVVFLARFAIREFNPADIAFRSSCSYLQRTRRDEQEE